MTEIQLKIIVSTDNDSAIKLVREVLDDAATRVGNIAVNTKNVAVEIKLDTRTFIPFRDSTEKPADAG